MAAPKARKPPAPKPAAAKELRPWQLGVFVLIGLIIAGVFVGVGFAKKSHDEYGQWPWARTAVPPKMYYDHQNYAAATVPAPTTLVRVGTTPGGGEVYAPSTAKTPAPPTIQVRGGGASRTYTIVPKQ